MEGFRTGFSISVDNKWHVALMDMITAFLQALGFDREIYVPPPREADETVFFNIERSRVRTH